MRVLLSALLLLPLLLTVSGLPADLLTSEGSGDDAMLNDAADPSLLSESEDVPLDLKVLESENVDDKGTAEKDELFSSLADLLKRVQELESDEPELEPETETELEFDAEPEPKPELEPEPEPEPEPEGGSEVEEETAEEPEEELGRREQQTNSDLEQASAQESDEGVTTEHEEALMGPELQDQEPYLDQGQQDQESEQEQDQQIQEPDQEPSGTEKPDLDTAVFTVQLLNVSVVPEPVVPEPVVPESDVPEPDVPGPVVPEPVVPEPVVPEPVVPEPDVPEPVGPEPDVSEPAEPEPAAPSEAPVTRPTEPADQRLGQNEVPLPFPARLPVHEPLIIAETAACLGCVTPIMQDGADLRRVANMAANLLEEELESRFTLRVTEVYRASKQVVNGIKYFLTLEVASTSCERPLPPFTLCFVASDSPRLLYAVEILHQPHRANTELISLRKMEHSEIAGLGAGLFAAASVEPTSEAPHRETAPIASSDSLLDILMGLDSVLSKQREQQPAGETDAPEPPQLQADRADRPPLQADRFSAPALQADRAGAPPLRAEPPLQAEPASQADRQADRQAEPAIQADWQAGLQLRHSTSEQALQVQALLQDAGWQGPGAERWAPPPPPPLDRSSPPEEADKEPAGCRAGRQYDVQQVPLNVAHPRVQKILHKFLETQERTGSQRLVITEVQSATQQTIAETNYRFELVLGTSACLKNSTAHRYSCSARSTNPLSNCRVRARHRPGKPLQFNSISCTSQRQPQCANGRCQLTEIHPYAPLYVLSPKVTVEVDIFDETYQQLVQHVQNEVNRRSRRPFLKKFIKTLNATKVSYNLEETSEIVDQELYSLTLRFAETLCARTVEPAAQEDCLREWQPTGVASAAHPTSVCDVRVSSLGWADRMRVLDLFCETEVAPAAA